MLRYMALREQRVQLADQPTGGDALVPPPPPSSY
jgi:hypothetical protein